jgi:hypothetical protein
VRVAADAFQAYLSVYFWGAEASSATEPVRAQPASIRLDAFSQRWYHDAIVLPLRRLGHDWLSMQRLTLIVGQLRSTSDIPEAP